MSLKSFEELRNLLVRMQLVTPDQLQENVNQLGSGKHSAMDLLSKLEQSHTLTSYQVSKIREGEPDVLVLGDFKLMYRNASGSFARVFRACSISTGQMVGLKLLRSRWANDPEMVSAFHREAELCQRLRHPNIVPIFEIGQKQNYHYFTMEFVEGGNLRDFIKIRKKLTPEEATRYVLDIAQGLEYAMNQGLTHRDLKMTNVLMSIRGIAKLVDFGLAGNDGESGSTGDDVQRALEYATLEKATNAPQNDPRSDLFFLGTIYYELLTGQSPYPRTNNREERKQLSRYQNIPPIRNHEPGLHRPVVKVVEQLLQINPALRFQTPGEVVAELRELLQKYLKVSDSELSLKAAEPQVPKPPSSSAIPIQTPSVMCVENREKQQDLLRKGLNQKGFRPLIISDLQRAVNRLQSNPPDCILFMGGGFDEAKLIASFQQAVKLSQAMDFLKLGCVIVLSKSQTDTIKELQGETNSQVLIQPVTLRELVKAINVSMGREDDSSKKKDKKERDPQE